MREIQDYDYVQKHQPNLPLIVLPMEFYAPNHNWLIDEMAKFYQSPKLIEKIAEVNTVFRCVRACVF